MIKVRTLLIFALILDHVIEMASSLIRQWPIIVAVRLLSSITFSTLIHHVWQRGTRVERARNVILILLVRRDRATEDEAFNRSVQGRMVTIAPIAPLADLRAGRLVRVLPLILRVVALRIVVNFARISVVPLILEPASVLISQALVQERLKGFQTASFSIHFGLLLLHPVKICTEGWSKASIVHFHDLLFDDLGVLRFLLYHCMHPRCQECSLSGKVFEEWLGRLQNLLWVWSLHLFLQRSGLLGNCIHLFTPNRCVLWLPRVSLRAAQVDWLDWRRTSRWNVRCEGSVIKFGSTCIEIAPIKLAVVGRCVILIILIGQEFHSSAVHWHVLGKSCTNLWILIREYIFFFAINGQVLFHLCKNEWYVHLFNRLVRLKSLAIAKMVCSIRWRQVFILSSSGSWLGQLIYQSWSWRNVAVRLFVLNWYS